MGPAFLELSKDHRILAGLFLFLLMLVPLGPRFPLEELHTPIHFTRIIGKKGWGEIERQA